MREIISKINLVDILANHFDTLRDNSTGKTKYSDYAVIYGIPAAIAIATSQVYPPPRDLAGAVINFFSIFSALLFNFLLLVLDAIRKEKEKPEGLNTRPLALLEETYKNVAYAIVVSLFGVVIMLVPYVIKMEEYPRFHPWFGAVIYFAFLHFLFVMAMILKRMNAIVGSIIGKKP